ncbi:MAG: signal recognition particle protein Srp54 [Methanobrevibacter sp.]|uniref:signal recognition particle protein Srp54 n=1 Tax=Methanobrevibacter sp. TaxID=66852 RepID=UPI0026DF9263|nr:signal recognition particle protein Srp54 [Methanobrevibacter sp.]MDO5848618.1 signal recognition particle protein Srp54 [Methanobrevibacter sp.]
MLGSLGENLTNTMKKLVGMSVIDKKTIKEVVKEIQRALIQSDVNIALVLDLSKKIEKRALEEEPPKGITPREHVITIIYEEMVNLLGKDAVGLDINQKPYKILLLGLQGSGKTTTIGKMCRYLQKKGFNPAVVCTDTWRPAAYEQLRQLTEEMQIPLYGDPENKDALDLAEKGLKEFKNKKVIIFDTAGRHKEESDLIAEMDELDNIIQPTEAMLVIDGTIGQQAGEQAKAFSQATDIGSIIITKLDGSAKGGGALSAVAETGAPIKFIGTGERIDDFELFDPERFISRLLGMGDIQTLIEKAEENIDEDIASKTMENMMSGKFTLTDVRNQFEMMNNMGPMQQVLNMIPGLGGKIPKEASKMTEDKIETYKIMMSSMTQKEMDNPKLIKQSRIKRIARGAGVEESEVKELLKYYNNTKKAMKGMGRRGRLGSGAMNRMMGQFMR